MSTEPWYREGLAFRCTQCGDCCTGDPGVVWVTDEEIAAIAKYRGESVGEVMAVYTKFIRGRRTLREKANGDCVFWEKGRGCTVYPVRPPQCRTWPFWASNIETPADWEQTVAICPGAGQGELISVEEIVARMKVIKM